MSSTRYEWTLADFAIWSAGAVAVPIYETSSAEQISWILGDSDCVAVILETPAHARDAGRGPRPACRGCATSGRSTTEGWTSWPPPGPTITDAELDERRARVAPRRHRDDHLHLRHHRAAQGLRADARQLHGARREHRRARSATSSAPKGASTLLFLPLAHVFARFIEVLCVHAGARLGHTADIRNLLDDFAELHPDVHPGRAPGVREGLQLGRAEGRRRGQGQIFARPRRTRPSPGAGPATTAVPARCCGSSTRSSTDWSTRSSARPWAARSQYAVSGGGPLGERLGHFFRGIGLTVLEGYGLTETTAPATVNRPALIKIGTVGAPLPGVAIRIADDGEVLVKGNNVFARYRNNEDGHRGGVRRRLVPHRRHRRARRRRLPADHRPQEGDPGDRRRQERRAGRAGGPAPRPPAGLAVHRGGRPEAVHRRAGHPRRRDAAGLGPQPRPRGA